MGVQNFVILLLMKTTFILHGGLTSIASQNNALFFKTITSKLEDGDKVLFVGFARDDEKIQDVYERDKKSLLEQTDRSIIVVNATHENFTEQVKSSAVVYITGGDTRKLLKEVKQHPDFLKLIDGKTIAGSSAGANVFSSLYYSTALKTVCEGLGILPFLLVCHYGNKEMGADERAVSELKQHNSAFEVITLAEQEFNSLEIDLSN
jgi:peptidase E